MLKNSEHFGLGKIMPHFCLPDAVSGQEIDSKQIQANKAYILLFICNHCPYVRHIIPALTKLAGEWHGPDYRFIAISANDPVEYPSDAPDKMRQVALDLGWKFPYLFDESQEVYKQFGIICTPEVMVFADGQGCLYHGQFDATRPGSGESDGADLQRVLESIAEGKAVPAQQVPSIGCSVKWRSK